MRRFERHAAAGAALALLLAAGTTTATAAADPTESQPMIGTEAPGFDLKTVAGDTVALTELRGKILVIHFGTSW